MILKTNQGHGGGSDRTTLFFTSCQIYLKIEKRLIHINIIQIAHHI